MIHEILKKYLASRVMKKYPASGQKQVYLVETSTYGVAVLKIINQMDDRIKREIDIVNGNDIPGVPKIFEVNSMEYNGAECYYFFEEYIDGKTLTEKLAKGPLQLRDALKLMEDLLIVVVKLEELKIVHRDIKPDNIMCDQFGDYRLIDFGIARNLNLSSLTLTSMAVGPHTPGYGAPELFQYNKHKINSKADLFSIGVVMYQSIFGRHPFVTGTEADYNEIWYKTATMLPKYNNIPGDTDGQLIGLIQTMMQKQVIKRPPSAKKALEWYYVVISTLSI